MKKFNKTNIDINDINKKIKEATSIITDIFKLDPTNVSGSQGSFNEQIKQLEKKAKKLNTFVRTETNERVHVKKVEFMEHNKNTAIYEH